MKLLLGGNQYFCHPIIPGHHLTSTAALAASVLCIDIYVCYCNLNSSFVLNCCTRSVSLSSSLLKRPVHFVFETEKWLYWTVLSTFIISLNDSYSLYILVWHCCVCAWWLFSKLTRWGEVRELEAVFLFINYFSVGTWALVCLHCIYFYISCTFPGPMYVRNYHVGGSIGRY